MNINTGRDLLAGPNVIETISAAAPRTVLVVVDARPFMRDCLARWLAGEMSDLDIGVLSDASLLSAPETEPAASPALALLFLAGSGTQSANWLREQVEVLRARDEAVLIAILVDQQDAERAEELVEALSLQGYIPTSSSGDVVRAALRLVLAGGAYLPRASRRPGTAFDEMLHPDPARALRADPQQLTLTPREDRVLELLAKGLPNKTIAYRLGMSVSTVKVHVHHLIQKMHAQNRTELAILAPTFRAARLAPPRQD